VILMKGIPAALPPLRLAGRLHLSTGLLAALCLAAPSSYAQEGKPQSPAAAQAAAADTEDSAQSKAPTGFGGPSSVAGTLHRDEQVQPTLLESYIDFKDRIEKEVGLTFGFDYQAVYQAVAADDRSGENCAAGGIVRFFGSWDLLNRDTPNRGGFVYNLENRHRLGSTLAPQDLGSEVGYVGSTDIIVGDIDWALTNLYWEQHFAGDRGAFVAGIVDTGDYVDIHGLNDPWSGFGNLAFSTNPTISTPNQGLGAAFRANVTEQIYIVGGIADANGDPGKTSAAWRSFFETGEHFTHIEIGWFPSFERRFTDNIHLTAWHAEARQEAETPAGWGLAASWSRVLGESWQAFLRAGYADGGAGPWDRALSSGFGYSLRGSQDLLGVGLNWGRPSRDGFDQALSDEYTAELFYRWRPLRLVTLTPDLQLLIDPALNESQNLIAVFSLRLSLTL
jgi:porin